MFYFNILICCIWIFSRNLIVADFFSLSCSFVFEDSLNFLDSLFNKKKIELANSLCYLNILICFNGVLFFFSLNLCILFSFSFIQLLYLYFSFSLYFFTNQKHTKEKYSLCLIALFCFT